jgi:predicted ATPase
MSFVRKLEYLSIENLRCFSKRKKIFFSHQINLLVGHNNSGKSTILRAIYTLQGNPFSQADISKNSSSRYDIEIGIAPFKDEWNLPERKVNTSEFKEVFIRPSVAKTLEIYGNARLSIASSNRFSKRSNLDKIDRFKDEEPDNILYPIFSNGKLSSYRGSVLPIEAKKIIGTLENLFAKVDRLLRSRGEANKLFTESCKDILGFIPHTEYVSDNSVDKYISLYVDEGLDIPLESMGDGVANILGIIADICAAEEKIFLIEEPENDLHPKALKALLKIIERKSNSNQFFISTHSNIVVRYLGGGRQSKVFHIVPLTDYNTSPTFPISEIHEVSNKPEERTKLLEDLGYDAFDYSLWEAWLFLEESSAEQIIREFLITIFTPDLSGRLLTLAAQGIDDVEPRFIDFNRLFVFLHREQTHKNKAWVIVDAGTEGSEYKENKIIDKLKEIYVEKNGWNLGNFQQFSEHDFERYYPADFQSEFDDILAISVPGNKKQEKQDKKDAKAALLNKVKAWLNADRDRARAALEQSAGEVIKILKQIEVALA